MDPIQELTDLVDDLTGTSLCVTWETTETYRGNCPQCLIPTNDLMLHVFLENCRPHECCHCGSPLLQLRGEYETHLARYCRWRPLVCGGILRRDKNGKLKDGTWGCGQSFDQMWILAKHLMLGDCIKQRYTEMMITQPMGGLLPKGYVDYYPPDQPIPAITTFRCKVPACVNEEFRAPLNLKLHYLSQHGLKCYIFGHLTYLACPWRPCSRQSLGYLAFEQLDSHLTRHHNGRISQTSINGSESLSHTPESDSTEALSHNTGTTSPSELSSSPFSAFESKGRPKPAEIGRKNDPDYIDGADSQQSASQNPDQKDLSPRSEAEQSTVSIKPVVRKHPAKFFCNQCQKGFTRAFALRAHTDNHNNVRRFICRHETCSRAFARNQDRQTHELSHTGVRKFWCKGRSSDGSWVCGQSFSSASNRARHLHNPANQRCRDSVAPVKASQGRESAKIPLATKACK